NSSALICWNSPVSCNIANFTLGRAAAGGEAIALLYVDAPVPDKVIAKLHETGLFQQIKALEFEVS
ncbi:MAG: hypothetical protein AAFY06_13550, partial [Pseudomonadota bacterium]